MKVANFVKSAQFYNRKTRETVTKIEVYDHEGDYIKTFVGVAKCNEADEYNERMGNRLSELRAYQKAHKWLSTGFNRTKKEEQQVLDRVTRLADKYTTKYENISKTIEDLLKSE